MDLKIIKSGLVIASALSLGIGATFASFTSNVVSITGSTVTTGEAALKVCDVGETNKWSNTISPSLSISGVIPGEERDLLGTHEIYLGNDDGNLTNNLMNSACSSYSADPVGSSDVAMKILPNVFLPTGSCPDALTSNIKLRFEVNGTSTDAKTLNAWVTNTTQAEPILGAGQEGQLKVYAQLSSTTTSSNTPCSFTLNFTGKQA
jgi:hypothetical protein